jgi:16S rRNA (cytidine1402-2'-O)-methyltransferase
MSIPGATLFVVATPLGNLDDFSPRAVQVLGAADALYAEDTRRSRVLLDHFGIAKRLESLHEHNERERSAEVLAALARGERVAILTDAGTPAVSDPGTVVVARAAAAGFRVSPVPGPSALTAALSVAGFDAGAEGVLFLGFLPARGRERAQAVTRAVAHRGVVVLFEAPHRAEATFGELAAVAPERAACAGRELTKLHEEIKHGTLRELAAWAAAGLKGELTIVLAGLGAETPERLEPTAIDGMIERCLAAGLSARDTATAVAAVSGEPRREVYARCQVLKPEG